MGVDSVLGVVSVEDVDSVADVDAVALQAPRTPCSTLPLSVPRRAITAISRGAPSLGPHETDSPARTPVCSPESVKQKIPKLIRRKVRRIPNSHRADAAPRQT